MNSLGKKENTLRDVKEIENIIKMLIVRCLEHDRDSFTILGDERARIIYGN